MVEFNMIKQVIVATLISIFSIAVNAKAVAFFDLQTPGDKIVLHDEQKRCSGEFFDAMVTWQGRPLEACWRFVRTPSGVGVHIKDSEGDEGLLPAAAFQPVKDL